MSTTMKASEIIGLCGKTLKSLLKICLQSRPVKNETPVEHGSQIIVLANGPSLRTTMTQHMEKLQQSATLAVNFMANAAEFRQIKPRYYVLADPHFFEGLSHENVKDLWQNLRAVDWSMRLYVPRERMKQARILMDDSKVELMEYNFVGVEGFAWFENLVFKAKLAMPRPRNVLIPALMAAIRAGYTEVYVVGADHSWMETLQVTEENHLVSVQPHFYNDSKSEQMRSATEYRGYRLHQILDSFRIAFESYHHLRRYTDKHNIHIYNSTPGSYIDAFERKEL